MSIGMDRLVERQVKRWQLLQQHRRHASRRPQRVIAISRRHGAGGELLGSAVAARMRFDYWDSKLLAEMATHADISQAFLGSLDEQPRNVVNEMLAVFFKDVPTTSKYMRELLYQLHAIAAHGHAVVVGRGAQFILQPSQTLRVRLVAPMEQRVHNIMAGFNLNEAQAHARILDIDSKQAQFLRREWSRDIGDLSAYDMVLNAEHLDLAAAEQLVCTAYEARFGPVGAHDNTPMPASARDEIAAALAR